MLQPLIIRKNRALSSVIVMIFLLLPFACTNGDFVEKPTDPPQTSDPATPATENTGTLMAAPRPIYYGQTSPTLYTSMTTSQQNAVMALWNTTYNYGFCTSTLISPHVVLTAAHCVVQDGYQLSPSEITVRVGSNAASPIATLYPSAIHVKTGYSPSTYDADTANDVAVLILSSGYTGVTPIPIKQNGLSGLSGHSAQSVGYGRTQNNDNNNIRYWTTMPVEYVSNSYVEVNGSGSTGLAPGDSGGPLLYNFGSGLRVVGAASTSEEGWVYHGYYAPLSNNETWIQAFVDQYDNAECVATCQQVECGSYQGCECGSCSTGEICQSNQCEEIQAGTGGACVTLSPSGTECSSDSECGSGAMCVQYQGGSSECGEECGPEACSPNDSASFCYPFNNGEISLCLEDSPESCPQEGYSCTTSDNRSGVCTQVYQDGPIGCYTYCTPVVTCPQGTACLPMQPTDCTSWCEDNGLECDGEQFGCDCGQCGSNEVCDNFSCRPYGSCGELPMAGCCAGDTLRYCYNGEPGEIDCGSQGCGWQDSQGYTCGGSGENETYPIDCPTPDCSAHCQEVECGDFVGCDCGSCGSGYHCDDNTCVQDAPGCDVLCQQVDCGSYEGCECGLCPTNYTCESNTCVANCERMCYDVDCGSYHGCDCGGCESGYSCVSNTCTPDGPDCSSLCEDVDCGSYQGCDCGGCQSGYSCVSNTCTPDGPDCASYCEDVDCGSYQGCDCGGCESGYSCVENTCTPDGPDCTSYCEDVDCGSYQGCNCGDCQNGYSCVENTCTPDGPDCTALCSDVECGSYQGCDCGGCATGTHCESNVCVDDLPTCDEVCEAVDCGSYMGCTCGSCQNGYHCAENACVEDAATCTDICQGIECGDVQDCNCGVCGDKQECREQLCVDVTQCSEVCADVQCGVIGDCQCGSCPQDTYCENGYCKQGVCEPDCNERACGDDGCGNSCGWCEDGKTCNDENGQCEEPVCVADCQNKNCGDDGCGGSCGTCLTNQLCQSGVCVAPPATCTPQCLGKVCGDDGCGGSCGSCGDDERCSNVGKCVSTDDDGNNEDPTDGSGSGCRQSDSPMIGWMLLMLLGLVGLRRKSMLH